MARKYPQFRKTGYPSLYVRHAVDCPLAWQDVSGKRCNCVPSYRGVRRHRVTGKRESSQTSKDKEWVKDWLRGAAKGTEAIRAEAELGTSFEALGREWLTGVDNGTIQRRRRGKPEPYSQTTITPYKRDFENLLRKPEHGFGPRPANSIGESEWQEFFDELREQGLSYSRVANIKAVASSIYAWASHRTRRTRTGVTVNPLRDVDLGANDGARRERIALPAEAAELLAALELADRMPYALAFYAGLRRQEIDRLDWRDIEFIDRRPGKWLHVRPIDAPAKGRGKVAGGRDVPIAEPLEELLLVAHEAQGRPWSGKVITASVMSGKLAERVEKAWDAANAQKAERLGQPLRKRRRREPWGAEHLLERITLHECRHTYCSYLVAARADLAQIMEWMGHTQVSTTQRYMHVIEQEMPKPDMSGGLSAFLRQPQAT